MSTPTPPETPSPSPSPPSTLIITRPCPFTPYDDVSVSWFVDLCQQVLTYPMKNPRKKGQSGGHHKLSLLLLATYQKHFPAKFDRTDVHLSKLMHRNR